MIFKGKSLEITKEKKNRLKIIFKCKVLMVCEQGCMNVISQELPNNTHPESKSKNDWISSYIKIDFSSKKKEDRFRIHLSTDINYGYATHHQVLQLRHL